MTSTKMNFKFFILLFAVILALSALLLQESLSTPHRADKINQSSKQFHMHHQISEDLTDLTANGQNYILYSDQRFLDDFKNFSVKTMKDELELYNTVIPSKKQGIKDMIDLSKTYIAFIENESMQRSGMRETVDPDHLKYLLLRHNELDQQLRQQANEVATANMNELNDLYQAAVTAMTVKETFLILILLSVTALLLWGIYTVLISLSIRRQYLDKMSEHMKSTILLADRKGSIKEVSQSAQDLFGLSPEKILKVNISEIPALFPRLQNIIQPLFAVIMQKKELLDHHVPYFHSERKMVLTVDYIPILIGKRLKGVMLIAKQAEAKKDKHLLLDTLEVERKRISIEIHDWIARYLSTFIHSIDYILRLKHVPEDELGEHLRTIRAQCQNAAIEMRSIMNTIHPYLIDKVGLVSALESYIDIFQKLNNIKVYVFYQNRSLSIPKKNEIIIYRIIQEVLSNTAKHSKSTEVDIRFTVLDNALQIEIEDNGGHSGEFSAGKGIWGMKERAKLIGGDIIFGYNESGFRVILTVPMITGGRQDGENQGHAD